MSPDRAGDPASRRPLPPWLVVAAFVVGVVAVSSSAVLVRLAVAPALALAFWRCGLGALALAPFALLARRGAARLDRGQRFQLVASGVALALHFALFISSLSLTSVASATLLVTTAPLFVGLGAALFLREPPSRRVWTGIATAVAGAAVIAVADAGAAHGTSLLGDALAFGGALTVAVYLVIGRAARQRLPVSVYAASVYGVAAVLLLAAAIATRTPLVGYPRATWLAIGALVLGPQLLGHTVFNTLLSHVTATVVAIAVVAEPLGATALAWWLLNEAPTAAFWFGAPLLLSGVWLAATGGSATPEPVGADGVYAEPE